jgi:hypothetical protein
MCCDEPHNVLSFKICTVILDKGEVIPGLNQAPHNEDVYWSRCIALPLLTFTLVGGDLLPSHTCRITPADATCGIICMGVWVDPVADLNVREKRTISCPCQEAHKCLVIQPVA